MKKAIVRYKLKPGKVSENEELVRNVFEQLNKEAPAGLSYSSFKLEDGLSFVHIVITGSEDENTLSQLSSFKLFQKDIKERYEAAPVIEHFTVIGSYASSHPLSTNKFK